LVDTEILNYASKIFSVKMELTMHFSINKVAWKELLGTTCIKLT